MCKYILLKVNYMLKKYGFFILLYFIAMLVKAETFEEELKLTPEDFRKQQCTLLEKGKITQGSCLVFTFIFKRGTDFIIKYNGTTYKASSAGCNDFYCKLNFLSSEEDKELSNGEAVDRFRDKNFKIVKDPSAKYYCLKRKKQNKPVYELCILNVSYEGYDKIIKSLK